MGYVKNVVAFRLVRFLIVGALNTAINFVTLNFAFYGLHQNKLLASFIATSCAVVFSFILNRSFVFVDKERPIKKLITFTIVTAGGVLLIQNSVYALGIILLHNHESVIINIVHTLTSIELTRTFVDINLSNIVASFIVMFWNYNGYRIFVFKGKRHGNEITETLEPTTA